MPKKKNTQSETRRHTFVPFNDRIAAIRIDPVRKVSKDRRELELDDDPESYFIAGLNHWQELNLTTNFTDFLLKCLPLAQSLPMLLYNQAQIFDLLYEHVEAADSHSVETMLDLLIKFARDLGADFEPYFSRTLKLLIDRASLDAGVASNLIIVENIFNAMAYLFKYLSRLLTSDLRPTYDLVSTLFGKDQKQRGYVLRFAAESLSFLLRKCSNESLHDIIEHVVNQVDDHGGDQHIKSSAMLLANSVKSTGNVLHSKTQDIMDELLLSAYSRYSSVATRLVADVLVDVLHHTRNTTADPLYDVVTQFLLIKVHDRRVNVTFVNQCVFVLAGLRKGSRVTKWEPLWTILLECLESSEVESAKDACVLAASAVLCDSDFENTSKYFPRLLKCLSSNVELAYEVFSIVAEFNESVYKTFVASVANSQLLSSAYVDELSALYFVGAKEQADGTIACNNSTEMKLKATIPFIPSDSAQLLKFWWHLNAFSSYFDSLAWLRQSLPALVSLTVEQELAGLKSHIVGKILGAHCLTSKEMKLVVSKVSALEPQVALFTGLKQALESGDKSLLDESRSDLINFAALSTNSWDDQLRRAAVDLCRFLTSEVLLDICLIVDDTPREAANAKLLAMHIRNLASKYAVTGANKSLDAIIPRYFLGLVSSPFQPIWKAALEAIPEFSSKCSASIWENAFSWVANPPTVSNMPFIPTSTSSEAEHMLDCVFLAKLQTIGKMTYQSYAAPLQSLQNIASKLTSVKVPEDLRSAAVKALATVPKIAEMHADKLVPYLLQDDEADDFTATSYKDRMALLDLFSKFTKPTKIAGFDKVYQQYLYYLGSRHLPIQKLAVKCVLSVNNESTNVLRKYRDNLVALTDETRFKDELTSIFGHKGSGEENAIHDEDRGIVLPIIIRILYGRAQIAKTTGGSKANQRRPVLFALHYYIEPRYQKLFLELAVSRVEFEPTLSSLRRQQGLISLLHDFVHELQSKTQVGFEIIVPALVHMLQTVNFISGSEDEEHILKVSRALRQSITKCLDLLFSVLPEISLWKIYFGSIYEALILPRLANFARLNLEQPSALMQMFKTLSTEEELVPLLYWDSGRTVEQVLACLSYETVKESVVSLVLTIVENLIPSNDGQHVVGIASLLVNSIPNLLSKGLSSSVIGQVVTIMDKLLTSGSLTLDNGLQEKLVSVILSILELPSSSVSTHVKAQLLGALSKIILTGSCDLQLVERAYRELAKFFRKYDDRTARMNLASCFQSLGQVYPQYGLVGELVVALNSYDPRRLGIPDFDRRLETFALINEREYKSLSASDWLVLLYNMLYFVRDPEELALRNNAALTLKRFVACVSSPLDSDSASSLKKLVESVLLPEIRLGLRNSTEAIRELFVELLGYIVETASTQVIEVADMVPLLFKDDEEANFFNNVYHIQVHRRRRAVQRLQAVSETGVISGASISHFLLPIIEHFVALTGNKNGELNNLADDTVNCIGTLTRHVTWNQFKAITKRYVSQVISRPLEIKVNGKLLNSMGHAMSNSAQFLGVKKHLRVSFVLNEVIEPIHKLMTLRINEDKNLQERISLAVAVILFLKALPSQILEINLPGKLSWLCSLLRSKVQELRDIVRSTLAKIARILGPKYLQFFLLELRSSLRRGPQLHVLGFTSHSLLVELKPDLTPGDLDACAAILSSIVMEDIFGATAEEKESEGYTAAAKEVKQHKSYDTAEILASNVSLSRFNALLEPLQHMLYYTKINLKTERKVDDLLRRIYNGLHHNAGFNSQDSLVMCYQLFERITGIMCADGKISSVDPNSSHFGRKEALNEAAKIREEHFTVRLSSRNWDDETGPTKTYASNLYSLQAFSLDTLRTLLAANDTLLTIPNVKGLIPLIIQGVSSNNEGVQVASLRLSTLALKLPLQGIDDTLTSLGRRALALVKTSTNNMAELFQSCLKFLAMLLRYKPDIGLKDSGIAYVLDRIKPDLEESDKNGTVIAFIRATLNRRVLIPQVYDVMGMVGHIMITNQSTHIRAACRSAYFQFLTEYPLSKTKLDKSFAFLVSNLQYESASGRKSALEVIHMIVRKVQDDQLEYSLTSFFVGLVLVLVNDSEPTCRSNAASLIKELLATDKVEVKNTFVEYCTSWLGQFGTNDLLVRGGLETAALMAEAGGYVTEYPNLKRSIDVCVTRILKSSKRTSAEQVDWQLIYLALQYLFKVRALQPDEIIDLVDGALLFPHPWVRASASRLMGQHYGALKQASLSMEESRLTSAARKSVRQLGAPQLQTQDGVQIVKNLVFIVGAWKPNASLELKDGTREPCIEWLFRKVCQMLRTDIRSQEFLGSKIAGVQLLAALAQSMKPETLKLVAIEALSALFLLNEQVWDTESELKQLAQQTLQLYDAALGTTEFLQLYTKAKQSIQEKRIERKSKRAIEAVSDPAIYAKKKMKKNFAKKESRRRHNAGRV